MVDPLVVREWLDKAEEDRSEAFTKDHAFKAKEAVERIKAAVLSELKG